MTYIIAEIGSTHDGGMGLAEEMIAKWAELGADAVKFQDHRWQDVAEDAPHPSVHVTEMRAAYYRRISFSHEQLSRLSRIARRTRKADGVGGLDFIVSPFSVQAVEDVEGEPVTAWKIASGEVTNMALLEAVKATGKPVYLSSGMSTWDEVKAACDFLAPHSLGCIMHCTSEYPCAPEHVGLNCVRDIITCGAVGRRTTLPWAPAYGLSDHTLGLAASLAAITLGATVIERHVTLSRRMYGSDAAHSLEPDEFAQFVREVRELDRMLESPVDKDALVQTPEIQRMREVFLCR